MGNRLNNRHTEGAFTRALAKNRMTRQRKAILSAICDTDGTGAHIDAHALYLKAKERDRGISLPTVYRALAVFARQGLVRKIVFDTGRHFYEIAWPDESHHFVCLGCGGISDLNPVLNKDERLLWQKEVEVVAVQVTIKGYCAACRVKEGTLGGMS